MLSNTPLRPLLLVVLPFVLGLTVVQPEGQPPPETASPEIADPAAVGEPVPARIELLPDVGGLSLDLILLGLLGLGYGAYRLRGETEPSAAPATPAPSPAAPAPTQASTRSSREDRPSAPGWDPTSRAPHGT
jgi:hypothetical protein